MSIDLEKDLRTYVSYLDSVATQESEVEGAVLVDVRSPSSPPATGKRRPWVAATAAVVTVLLLGLIPLLINDVSPVGDTVVPTTLAESTPTTLAQSTPTTLAESTPATLAESAPTTLAELTSTTATGASVPPDPVAIPLGEGVVEFVGGLGIPNDLEFDPSGGLFVSESGEGRVIRVEILPDGSAGDSVVVISDLHDAEGLALSDDGVLYVSSDSVVYRVVDGVGLLFAGEFHDPEGLAIDANGDLYVAHDDEAGIRITKVAVLPDGTAGAMTDVVIVPGNTAADIDFGPDGKLFVANDSDAVWVVDVAVAGVASSRMFAMIPGGTRALAFDQFGTLYAASEAEGTVWAIDQAGQAILLADGFGTTEGLVVDASGILYISTWSTNQVLRSR